MLGQSPRHRTAAHRYDWAGAKARAKYSDRRRGIKQKFANYLSARRFPMTYCAISLKNRGEGFAGMGKSSQPFVPAVLVA